MPINNFLSVIYIVVSLWTIFSMLVFAQNGSSTESSSIQSNNGQRTSEPSSWINKKAYFIYQNKMVDFHEAGKLCNQDGHVLLSIETEDEQKQVSSYLDSVCPQGGEWWTSGADDGRNGHFEWTAYGTSFTYMNFVPNYVQDTSDYDCVVFQQPGNGPNIPGSFDYQWDVVDCESQRYFVCESVF